MFLLIALPLFLFGTAMAIDFSHVLVNFNQNTNIAEAAANAGVTARDINTGQLDTAEALRRANDLCSRMGVTASCATANGPVVTVTVPMDPFTLYANWFNLPNGRPILNMDFSVFTAEVSASVCNSYTPTGTSDTYCVRPKG